jgi:hypothetical protein
LFGALGDSEIGDLGSAGRGQQDVGRFDVSMDDARVVGGGHRLEHVEQDRSDLVLGERALGQLIGESPPRKPLHNDVRDPAVLAGVVHRDRLGVDQHGGGPGLVLETPADVALGGQVGAENFDRHRALEAAIPPVVDVAHPAPAQEVPDLVAVG